MNHQLLLTLRLVEGSGECYVFVLTMQNLSTVKLLMPVPDHPSLRFKRFDNGVEAEWYTHLFVSADWAGCVLMPNESHDFTYSVKTTSAKPDHDSNDLRFRWKVDLLPGVYRVFFRFQVAADYFDGDSHWRLPQLQRRAAADGAEVWSGEVKSNELELSHNPLAD